MAADFRHIVDRFGPGLSRVAASYEADRALREDLLQEILIAVHRALPSLAAEASLAPFVFRIAHNRAATHVARRIADRRPAEQAAREPVAEGEGTPEQQMLADERAERLLSAVRRLPLGYRQVITLVLEELSYADIAEALGISVSNVGVRVNRAKAQLKVMLDEP